VDSNDIQPGIQHLLMHSKFQAFFYMNASNRTLAFGFQQELQKRCMHAWIYMQLLNQS
jgi:hypothetical protein